MKQKTLFLLLIVWFWGVSFAHQPRIVWESVHDESNPILVQNPTISQAFYGILSGTADVYQIQTETGILLYANLVVPDLSGQRTDFVMEISDGSARSTKINGKKWQRSGFYEEFAGDMYLQWPVWEQKVDPGTYTITISNPGNQGKYSLAIGKMESFPVNEILHTFKVLPTLKTDFFDKPVWMVVYNKIWLRMGELLLVIAGLVLIVWGLVRYFKRK